MRFFRYLFDIKICNIYFTHQSKESSCNLHLKENGHVICNIMSSFMASSRSNRTIFPPYLFLSFIRVVFPAPQGVLDVEPEKLIGGFSQNDGPEICFQRLVLWFPPPKKKYTLESNSLEAKKSGAETTKSSRS